MKKFQLDFEGLSNEEKEQLLKWAEEVRNIQQRKDIGMKEKLNLLTKLNNKSTFRNTSKFVKEKTKKQWKNAKWPEKLAIISGGGTLAFFGFSGVGIAALGGAIGFPLFLLTASGGWFVGTIIERLKK